MRLEINKGPDFTPAQWTGAGAGFFVSAAIARFLVLEGYLTKNWAVVLVSAFAGRP
ncbi:hypothetical protein [Bradyrhizobium australiense]|uniref:Uncharacterized protein n=1 Tax=Bradyrhizobium australiense TaxID=2721161 RepID=A0A7Y4GWJ4_9BRAD|nr:hypothetical protein [Bradyrhizobium australiense]NOJ42998.1 hypothetical protein [Bradyrhizobium australiense]